MARRRLRTAIHHLWRGNFFLGAGSGENLNEHMLADRRPQTLVRLEMLEEAESGDARCVGRQLKERRPL